MLLLNATIENQISAIREIIKEHRFSGELQDLVLNSKRADEFVDGVKAVLCCNPEHGTQVFPGSPVWFIPINERVPGVGRLVIYYTFNEAKVWLLSIQETPEED